MNRGGEHQNGDDVGRQLSRSKRIQLKEQHQPAYCHACGHLIPSDVPFVSLSPSPASRVQWLSATQARPLTRRGI
eukprot:5161973-Pleurochrysis_carterae.AAC.3